MRIEPELQKEPAGKANYCACAALEYTSGRLRGNTRGNGATKEKNLTPVDVKHLGVQEERPATGARRAFENF